MSVDDTRETMSAAFAEARRSILTNLAEGVGNALVDKYGTGEHNDAVADGVWRQCLSLCVATIHEVLGKMDEDKRRKAVAALTKMWDISEDDAVALLRSEEMVAGPARELEGWLVYAKGFTCDEAKSYARETVRRMQGDKSMLGLGPAKLYEANERHRQRAVIRNPPRIERG